MKSNAGQCPCGQVTFTLSLPNTLDQYSPRACDCDFCTARHIVYLSDPMGELTIESQTPLALLRQGSNQAGFITCNQCNTVIAASLQCDNQLLGALNATLLLAFPTLQQPVVVSPKHLSADAKIERWKSVWLGIKVNGKPQI
jgi:hypothetical protein